MTDTNMQTLPFTVSEKSLAPNHAHLIIEPLENGFGHTLGNALRRVLLSSLPGVAFTSVRFEHVDHQFSSIEGVTEDVLELSLNLKSIRLKSLTGSGGVCRLNMVGPKQVTAADLVCEGGLEVATPDLPIATLTAGAKLSLELIAEVGQGYSLAKDRQTNTIGEIVLDALFSPVVTVSYSVEQTRVGRRTDFDKLILDVRTNGAITPHEAVRSAAGILVTQFSQIINPITVVAETPAVVMSAEEVEVLKLTVEELDLPTRIANALRQGGLETVADLQSVPRETLAKVKNLGEKSLAVVQEALEKKGATLQS